MKELGLIEVRESGLIEVVKELGLIEGCEGIGIDKGL